MFKKATEGLNHKLLWPALLALVAMTTLSVMFPTEFVDLLSHIQVVSMNYLGGTVSMVSLLCVLMVLAMYLSPLGKVKIGGSSATPTMNKWNWFAITLCTTIATGCVYWGIVQPIIHVNEPPIMWDVEPNSPQAIVKTMASIFLQWSLQPYAIFAMPTVIFAFAYYNMKQPYGIVSTLTPVLGQERCRRWFTPLSSLLLFVNVCAMCASLAQGMFNLSGAMKYIFDIEESAILLLCIGMIFVLPAIISSITGVLKGIKLLSDLNVRIYFFLLFFLFCTVDIPYVLNLGYEALGEFINTYFQQSLATGAASGDTFFTDWIGYNFGGMIASICFTPIFLGSLTYGRSIREVIEMNFFLPTLFIIVWMTLLSGGTISQDIQTGMSLTEAMYAQGANVLPYKLFDTLPFHWLITGLYLFAVLLSFVTYTDSALTAMGKLACTHPGDEGDQVVENPVASVAIKITLGIVLILLTGVMVLKASVDGARILASLSSWACMVIEIFLLIGAVKLMKNPDDFNYVETGKEEAPPKAKNKLKLLDIMIPGRTK